MKMLIKNMLCSLAALLACGAVAGQTLQQARSWYAKGDYERAKPVFERYVKSSPNNGNYNLWYGVSCLETGEASKSIPYLEKAVKRRVSSGKYYLGQAYHACYRFQEAVGSLETYIEEARKLKKEAEAARADSLLAESKKFLRMMRGVENVCIVDSFVVDKRAFLDAYRINENAGRLYAYNEFFQTDANPEGVVYQTEIGNKLYYSDVEGGTLKIFQKNKFEDGWSKGYLLPPSINGKGNVNYPFVLPDGITIYYATDGEGLGGYDIYVTRFNSGTNDYYAPENVGMPFNSPYNDYMYVVDEYANLGWFASDRFQPEGKVCIYVFIPNTSKRIYDYETTEPDRLIRLAQIHSLQETWEDPTKVAQARQRLQRAFAYKPAKKTAFDFEFVIDDRTTYYSLGDFKSAEAKQLFSAYQQQKKDWAAQQKRLGELREQYSAASRENKTRMAAGILDLEKRVVQMTSELRVAEKNIRNKEKEFIAKQK